MFAMYLPLSAVLPILTSLLLLFVATTSHGQQNHLRTVLDADGKSVMPLSSNAKAVVFIFVKSDCPISNRYAPEVNRLHEKFSSEGVLFWLVYTDADQSSSEIREHLTEYRYAPRGLCDPNHRLVELCGARVTPEAAVFAPNGRLVYHGRIDDRYETFGRWRPAPTRRDLEDVIAAILKDAPIPRGGPAVGCSIASVK